MSEINVQRMQPLHESPSHSNESSFLLEQATNSNSLGRSIKPLAVFSLIITELALITFFSSNIVGNHCSYDKNCPIELKKIVDMTFISSIACVTMVGLMALFSWTYLFTHRSHS